MAQLSPSSNMQLLLVLSLLLLTVAFYVTSLWRKRNMLIKSWNIPGPINLPFIGAAYYFMGGPNKLSQTLDNLYKKYQTSFKVWFGPYLIYGLVEPENIEKILGSARLVQKELIYKHIANLMGGDGLAVSPAPIWKKHRKAIIPAFNQKILDSFVEVFARKSKILCKMLKEHAGKKDVNMYAFLSRCTMDIIIETSMGVDLDMQRSNFEHVKNLEMLMKLPVIKLSQIWNYSDFIWSLLGYKKIMTTGMAKLDKLIEKVIQKKMEAQKKRKQSSTSDTSEFGTKDTFAFLDLAIESGKLDAKEIRDEVVTFTFAGTDTTSSAMVFIVIILGLYPDVQQKAYEEVIQVIGKNRTIEPQDLNKFNYLERVFKETLRLFPIGIFFLRTMPEDVNMGNFVIPKGASTFFYTRAIHRNPKYWPDPLKFDPDRFLPEEVKKRPSCAYVPFSYGPRNCIGKAYAMMSLKVIMAELIRNYKFYTDYKRHEDIRVVSHLVLRCRDGAKVYFTPRN